MHSCFYRTAVAVCVDTLWQDQMENIFRHISVSSTYPAGPVSIYEPEMFDDKFGDKIGDRQIR